MIELKHGARNGLLVAGMLALSLAACAVPGGAQGSLPPVSGLSRTGETGFDIARAERGTVLAAPGLPSTAAKPGGGTVAGLRVRQNSLTGSANRVARPGASLTGPSRQSPVTVAKGFLAANKPLFKLAGEDITALQPIRQYTTPGMGVTHLTLQEQHHGIPVFRSEVKFDVKTSGELLSVSGSAVPGLAQSVRGVVPGITPAAALRQAAAAAGIPARDLDEAVTRQTGQPSGVRRAVSFAQGSLYLKSPVLQLCYLPTARGETRLAWDTTLWQTRSDDVFHILIDAANGKLLYRRNYTNHATGRIYDHEAPQDGTPFTGAIPPVLDRVLTNFDGTAFFANPADPHRDWWGGLAQTNTFANNVLAGTFRTGSVFNDIVPAVGAGGVFDFALNLNSNPVTYQSASAANVFFWVNRCHDIWYTFGFDEASANFQENNFGLGGSQVDGVIALAQFQAGTAQPPRNNANFSTPPDGESGIMRMFEFDTTNPLRDGDLAADVIAHEFGHGLTNRIMGNGNGLVGFQPESQGEGWSDFQSLMVHAQAADNLTLPHPIGGYVQNDFASGIRSQPYSANRTSFTRTYADIGDVIPGIGPEVHLAGEIICNALFQTYGRLVSRLGFATGRSRMMQLFINACKLSPDSPTYLDFRDALLTADQQTFANDDKDDIWFAFAAHGMGVNASTTGVDDTDPFEDFSVPGGGGGGQPNPPSNFDMVLLDLTHADCTWNDNSNNETKFVLETSINGGAFTEQNGINIPSNITLLHLTLTNFSPGDTLAARIKAVNDSGASAPSNTDSVQIPEDPPAAPVKLKAKPAGGATGKTTIILTFKDFANNEDGFRVEVAGPGQGFTDIGSVSANTTNIAVNGLSPKTKFQFRIRAFNGGGNSGYSNTASAKTKK